MTDLDQLYNVIQKQKDLLDIIIANAGISLIALLRSIVEKQFDNTFNINVRGTLFTVQSFVTIS
jgi:NADP-dependent 3-hydroxy acid dehydrogenase YdfG